MSLRGAHSFKQLEHLWRSFPFGNKVVKFNYFWLTSYFLLVYRLHQNDVSGLARGDCNQATWTFRKVDCLDVSEDVCELLVDFKHVTSDLFEPRSRFNILDLPTPRTRVQHI